MNVNKLRGKIVENGMSVEGLARAIGIDRASMYRKLNNAEKITIGEAMKIINALSMDGQTAYEIFLS